MNAERKALIMSAVGALFFAALGFAFFIPTDSDAILLDGFFSLIGFMMGLLSLRVARLAQNPDDDRYHFGYAAFEPMLNTVKGLIILIVCLFAAASSVGALLDGGREIQVGWGVFYAIIASVGCFSLALVQLRISKKAGSQLVAVDARTWLIDGFMSLVVTLAFGGAYLLTGTQWSHLVPYIDPGLVLVLAVLMLPVPLRIIKYGTGELLKAAPDVDIQKAINQGIASALLAAKMPDHNVRMVRVGREFWVLVHVLLDENRELGSAADLDTVRETLHNAVTDTEPGIVVEVIFTARQDWV